MRPKFFLLLSLLLLAACRGTQPYTAQDLSQVKQGYNELLPTYLSFKRAYSAGNTAGILKYYYRERIECRTVDQVDNRDTIDPNVNLFQASIGLDNFCNAVESAYVSWAMQNRYPYPKNVIPARPFEAFIVSDKSLGVMPKYMRRPASLG